MERQIVLKVKGNNYTIEFPNVGKFQRIESMKQVISQGMYSQLISTATLSTVEALNMVDMEAYLSILAPQLIKDLKCDSFSELDIEDYLELKKVYLDQFVPWWNSILNLINPNERE